MSLDGKGLVLDDRGAPKVPGKPAVQPSAAEVARQVVEQLVLPEPVVRMNPGESVAQVVGVPTWLWIDRSVWRPVSKTAHVPGMVVTATATPERVVWSTGDGARVTCVGPGTPYSAKYAADSVSPDCGHVYRRSSAGRPGEAFTMTVTIVWDVVWQGGGRAGAVPGLHTAVEIPVRVSEVQALVVDGRRGR